MGASPPFRPDSAKDALEGDGDSPLPICDAEPDVMLGEELAIIVLTTLEGQRVGIPLAMHHTLETVTATHRAEHLCHRVKCVLISTMRNLADPTRRAHTSPAPVGHLAPPDCIGAAAGHDR